MIPLYLNVSGHGRCGKSAFLKCVLKYVLENAQQNFMKIVAFTPSAAYLVSGSTLHSHLKLPINVSKKKELPKFKVIFL